MKDKKCISNLPTNWLFCNQTVAARIYVHRCTVHYLPTYLPTQTQEKIENATKYLPMYYMKIMFQHFKKC